MYLVEFGALVVAALAGVVLCLLLLRNLVRPEIGFWPAASDRQKALALVLFRVFCAAMVVEAGLMLWMHGFGNWSRYAIGVPIMVGAYAMSLWAYKHLGKENTYFATGGLVTGGVYAYSRNPGYVASLAAALGLAVVAGSWSVLALAGGLFLIYFLFALNEERWLRQGYGHAFIEYMRQTPRFLDLRSLERAREELLARL